jgi:membrane dipeptidase
MNSKPHSPSILGHLDTFFALDFQHRKFSKRSSSGHCDYHRMIEANAKVGLFAIYPAKSQYDIIHGLDRWFKHVDDPTNKISHIKNIEDFPLIMESDKIGAILHAEGSGGIDSEFELLRLAAKLGLRSLGLTHANKNRFATGYFFYGGQVNRGLTSEGQALVHEAQDLGITIDVSHLNDPSFWDVIKITEKPLLATHSNARAICDMGRNLTDDQIKAMHEKKGVIGLNFGTMFLDPEKSREKDDLAFDIIQKHLDHIVELSDINTVAIGADFDGTRVPTCINSCEKMNDLYVYLLTHGYSQEDIKKISYDNFYRVFSATWI